MSRWTFHTTDFRSLQPFSCTSFLTKDLEEALTFADQDINRKPGALHLLPVDNGHLIHAVLFCKLVLV